MTPFNSTPTFARTERPSDFGARGDQAEFGASLARMHLAEPAVAEARDDGMFGFSVNNTIGDTPQPNAWGSDWGRVFPREEDSTSAEARARLDALRARRGRRGEHAAMVRAVR